MSTGVILPKWATKICYKMEKISRKRVPVLNARNSVRNSDERRNNDGDDGDDDGACYLFANFFGDFYGETNG